MAAAAENGKRQGALPPRDMELIPAVGEGTPGLNRRRVGSSTVETTLPPVLTSVKMPARGKEVIWRVYAAARVSLLDPLV
jgi:hypothetical protein